MSAKMIQLTQAQLAALIAQATGGSAAKPVEKPKRSLSFASYASGERADATAQAFAKALQTGDATCYAHASTAKRAVSAASVREILSDPVVRSAVKALLASLG